MAAGHRVVHREPHAYCAHPHVVDRGGGGWAMVFNRSLRRPFILHPPQDPYFHNLVTVSDDEGETWSPPSIAPDFNWHGVECAGLTPLPDGGLLLNQWQFRWLPVAAARRLPDRRGWRFPEDWAGSLAGSAELDSARDLVGRAEALAPWARGPGEAGRTVVHRSDDGGRSWGPATTLDVRPYSGGYGMRGAVALADGTLVLLLSDVPHYRRVFAVRSADGGASWGQPVPVAAAEGHEYEEPAVLVRRDGSLLAILRDNGVLGLAQTVSADGGLTWSPPEPVPLPGYPAGLLRLADGRVLCVTGHRRPDYSIRAALSEDDGRTWPAALQVTVRGGLPNRDLGYPSAVQRRDGRVAVAYYCQDADGVTGIEISVIAV